MSKGQKDYPSIREIVDKCFYGNKRMAFKAFLQDPQAFIFPAYRNGFDINKNTQLGEDDEKETDDRSK